MNILKQLDSIFRQTRILTGNAIAQRATSYWDASPMQGQALVMPESSEEISQVLKACNEAKQPVVVIGGNTGGVQGQHPNSDEVIISLERMNQIEQIDQINAAVTVQAGCILEQVQQAVAEQGMLYPIDLGGRGSATVGGNVSSNAGGVNVIRYGMMRNSVLGLEAVLADGTIVSSMNQMIKNNTGYDLKQLFIGSEGTLGVVTRVVVKLETMPTTVNTAMMGLQSFKQVPALLHHLRKTLGPLITAYEFMDNDYYRAVTGEGDNRAPMSSDFPSYVLTEIRGNHAEHDEEIFQQAIADAIEQGIVEDAVLAQSERQRQDLWQVRENFEPILRETPYFLYDVSLPLGAMEQYLQEVKAGIAELWPNALCASLAHVGDNNLHFFIAPRNEEQDAREKATKVVYQPLKELNGSISAEHGIGIEKKAYLDMSRTTEEIEIMRLLKRSLDPNNILAPGRVFDIN